MVFVLLFLGLINLSTTIAMEPLEVIDEVARNYAAEMRFQQETIDPQLLIINPSSQLEDPSFCASLIPHVDEAQLKSWKKYIYRFSLSKKHRKKSRAKLTDWFNSALDLLSSSMKQCRVFPIILSFSKTTGKTRYSRYYKPKIKADTLPNGTQQAVKINHSVKKTITKEQAQQWLYFKQNETQKTRKKKCSS